MRGNKLKFKTMETKEKRYRPKVDSKNQVTITRCKESWNREEVITILKTYHHHTQLIRKFKLGNSLDLNDWIKENL